MYIAFPLIMVIVLIATAYIYSLKKQIKAQTIQDYYNKRRLYSAMHNIAWSYYNNYAIAKKKSDRENISKRAAHTIIFVLYPGEGHDQWLENIDDLQEAFHDFFASPQTEKDRRTDTDSLYSTEQIQKDLAEHLKCEWDADLKNVEND